MRRPAAIFLCDLTGVAALPWAAAGYECFCVDVQHSIRRERVEGRIHFVWGDARAIFMANHRAERRAAA